MTKQPFRLSISLVAAALLFGGTAAAGWTHLGERSIAFKAVGPGGLGIEGKGNDVSLKEQGDSIVVTVGLGSVKTGIEMRDKHMHEKYLETPKYPNAVFIVEKSKIKSPGEGDADGKLQLHGVTKSVRIHFKATGSDKESTVVGSAHVNMKDFNIEVPSYLGVTVKPDVTVTFKLGAVDK